MGLATGFSTVAFGFEAALVVLVGAAFAAGLVAVALGATVFGAAFAFGATLAGFAASGAGTLTVVPLGFAAARAAVFTAAFGAVSIFAGTTFSAFVPEADGFALAAAFGLAAVFDFAGGVAGRATGVAAGAETGAGAGTSSTFVTVACGALVVEATFTTAADFGAAFLADAFFGAAVGSIS